jgi:5,10-methylenetetrahydromethanopterin reductase
MTEPFTFSLRLNNNHRVEDYVRFARAAEAAGFDQIWVSNDLFLRSSPVILAAMAGATERIGIGTCVLNPYTIDPSEIAMIAATLDELSGNRFRLGLAAGARDFLGWVGIDQERPLAAMRESIALVRRLLAGEAAPIEGARFRWSRDAYLRFKAPRVTPIYVGALGPRMLALAGELADGVLPLLLPPEHYFQVKPLIEAGAASRAPSLPSLDLACCIWVSLSADRGAARRALAEKIAYYGAQLSPLILSRLSLTREDFAIIERVVVEERDLARGASLVDERMMRIGIVGQPEDVIERLDPIAGAGARHLSFGPPLGPDPFEAIDLLGRRVLPHFRA